MDRAPAATRTAGLLDHEAISEVGVLKPMFGDPWTIPRVHGLVEHACICPKRVLLATLVRPEPRSVKPELVVWSLDGPRKYQMVARTTMNAPAGSGTEEIDAQAVTYLEILDSWAVLSKPAVLHLFNARDLKPLMDPYSMHNRQLTCWAQCRSKSELIIGCFDAKVSIFTLSKEKNWRTDDPNSCVKFEFTDYKLKSRLSWSVSNQNVWVTSFVVDENFHNEGYRVYASVVDNIYAYDWETSAILFRIHRHAAEIGSRVNCMELRHDTPMLIVGGRDNKVTLYSTRPGSQGKVLDVLEGAAKEITGLVLDHGTRVLYVQDGTGMITAWDPDQHTILNTVNVGLKNQQQLELELEDKLRDNPWRQVDAVQCVPEMNFYIIRGQPHLLSRTPDHQEHLIDVNNHRRYLNKCAEDIIWLKAVEDLRLLRKLGWSKMVEIDGVQNCVILALSAVGEMQIFHAGSGDAITVISLTRCHELFFSGNMEVRDSQGKVEEVKKKGRTKQKAVKREQGAVMTMAEMKAREQKHIKSVITQYRLKSGNLTDAQYKQKQKRVQALQNQVAHLKAEAKKSAKLSDLGSIVQYDYVPSLKVTSEETASVFVIVWSGGSVDVMRLDLQECIQVYVDRDLTDCRPTSFCFFPKQEEGGMVHYPVIGQSNGMIKVWSPIYQKPATVQRRIKAGEVEDGAIVAVKAVEQVDDKENLVRTMLVITASGTIMLFKAQTWQLLVTAKMENMANEIVTGVQMFGHWLCLMVNGDGALQAWEVDCTDISKPLLGKLWPSTREKGGDLFHFGDGQIVECSPEEGRFISKSLSTGFIEWAVEFEDGILNITPADQLSRDSDLMSRGLGTGTLLPATGCAYIRGCNAAAVASGGEINLFALCLPEKMKSFLAEFPGGQAKAAADEPPSTIKKSLKPAHSPDPNNKDSVDLSYEVGADSPRSEASAASQGSEIIRGQIKVSLEDRIDVMHVMRSLDVVPTPFTVRFSSHQKDTEEARLSSALQSESREFDRLSSQSSIEESQGVAPWGHTLPPTHGNTRVVGKPPTGKQLQRPSSVAGNRAYAEKRPVSAVPNFRPGSAAATLMQCAAPEGRGMEDFEEISLWEGKSDKRRPQSHHHNRPTTGSSRVTSARSVRSSSARLTSARSSTPSRFGTSPRSRFEDEVQNSLSDSLFGNVQNHFSGGASRPESPAISEGVIYKRPKAEASIIEENIKTAESVQSVHRLFRDRTLLVRKVKKNPSSSSLTRSPSSSSVASAASTASADLTSLSYTKDFPTGFVFREVKAEKSGKPVKGGHPDPRRGFDPGSQLLGSWNKHVAPVMQLNGKHEPIRPKTAEGTREWSTSTVAGQMSYTSTKSDSIYLKDAVHMLPVDQPMSALERAMAVTRSKDSRRSSRTSSGSEHETPRFVSRLKSAVAVTLDGTLRPQSFEKQRSLDSLEQSERTSTRPAHRGVQFLVSLTLEDRRLLDLIGLGDEKPRRRGRSVSLSSLSGLSGLKDGTREKDKAAAESSLLAPQQRMMLNLAPSLRAFGGKLFSAEL